MLIVFHAMGKTALEVHQGGSDVENSDILLSAHDQMLDAVGDAMVHPSCESIRLQLEKFLRKIWRFEVSKEEFEKKFDQLLSRRSINRLPTQIVRSVRKKCEVYVGSLIHVGPQFPKWAQAKTAAVVDVNSTSVILDTHDHAVRKVWGYQLYDPLRMTHIRFLEYMSAGTIWVPSSQEVIELRRQAIRAEMGDNLQRIASLFSENDVLQGELDAFDMDI